MSFSFWRRAAWTRMVRTSVRPLGVEALEGREMPAGLFAVGSAIGAAPLVTVFDATTRQQKFTISPFEASFTGGVNVAIGDVTGDGTADVIVGAGAGGGSVVKVYDGTNGKFLKDFTLGDSAARSGVSVAAGDYNQDGVAEVVIGTVRSGQPLVQVLRYSDGKVLHGYTPLEGSTGVSVAAGDVNGDGVPDTIVGSGPGGGPRVVVFNGSTDAQMSSFFAFESTFTGGVQVSAGDLNADGKADIIAAAGFLGGPRIQSFSGANGAVISNFFAYDSTLRAGVTVAAFDANNDKSLDLVTVNGKGQAADIKAFDGRTAAQLTKPTFANPPVPASWDITAPTVALTTTAANPTKASPFPFTAKFSEVVNGFTLGGLTVSNGSVSNFTKVDGKTYTFTVTPTANGDTKVSVASAAAADAAGNGNAVSSIVTVNFDTAGPTATVTATTTNDTTPTLTGTVSEAGSTVAVTVNGQTYAATVTGTTWSATVTATLAAGSYTVTATATDAAGNVGQMATLANGLTVDLAAPTATVDSSAPDPTGTNPIPFTVTFNEDVTGFSKTDITVTKGSVFSFTSDDAKTYRLTVVPSGTGAVTVSVAAGTANDTAGNGNAVSNTFTRTFNGTVTTAAITSTETGPSKAATIPVKVTFSGDVTGFTQGDIGLTGGTIANFVAVDGHTYTFNVVPVADGTIVVSVPAGAGLSTTSKPTAAASFSIVSDRTAPTATLTSTAAPATNLNSIPFRVVFGEAVSGLVAAGIGVTNGTVSNIVSVDSKMYTFNVAPMAQGAVVVTVLANSVQDTAGMPSVASAPLTVTFDTTPPAAPAVLRLDPASDTGASNTDGITADTTPTIVGTAAANSQVKVFANGGSGATLIATVTADASGNWAATPTATLAEGTYGLTATATDAAGNASGASGAFDLVIDT